jgi:hypothetical protein
VLCLQVAGAWLDALPLLMKEFGLRLAAIRTEMNLAVYLGKVPSQP